MACTLQVREKLITRYNIKHDLSLLTERNLRSRLIEARERAHTFLLSPHVLLKTGKFCKLEHLFYWIIKEPEAPAKLPHNASCF